MKRANENNGRNFEVKIRMNLTSKWEKTNFGNVTFETACKLVKILTDKGCFYAVAKFHAE